MWMRLVLVENGDVPFKTELFPHFQLQAPGTSQGALGPAEGHSGLNSLRIPYLAGLPETIWGPTAALQDSAGHFGIQGMEFGVCQRHCGALQTQFKAHGDILGYQGCNSRPSAQNLGPCACNFRGKWGILGWQGCEEEASRCLWDRPRRTQSAQHTQGTTHLKDTMGLDAFFHLY